MKRDERTRSLVDAACDGAPIELDPGEAGLMAQFRAMASALSLGFHDAPAATIAAAQSIFPVPARRRLSIRLIGTTWAISGVRLAPGSEARASVRAEPYGIDLSYVATAVGTEVMGHIDGGDWLAVSGGQSVECTDGKFEILVPNGMSTAVTLTSRDDEIHIPPFEELGQIDADDRR